MSQLSTLPGTVLKGSCITGVTTSNKKVLMLGMFDMWINKKGIANLLSIPQLTDDGFTVNYDINGECVIYTPRGKKIVLQKDTGLCNRITFIDICLHKEAFALLQIVHNNFEGVTRRQLE